MREAEGPGLGEKQPPTAASPELAALADWLARMFPITPLDVLLHQYQDMAGHTAAIERLIGERQCF